jgi:cytochrome c553
MPRALLLLLLASACQRATAQVPDPPPETRFERDMMRRFHMHQSFDLVRAIERLLIRGKLEDAARFAEAIATAPDEPGLGRGAVHAAAVRERALAVSRAKTVDEALRAETRLAAACAGCHRELGGVTFDEPRKAPPDRPTLDARMARHRWAADRMWEGVVGDADTAWRDGLDVVAATPLAFGPELEPHARELQRLAVAARGDARPDADRAATYAELLVTCAGCHTRR